MSVTTRNQRSGAKGKGAQAREQAQAKSTHIRRQAQAKSGQMRTQAQARSAQMREQARSAARSRPARQARRAAKVAPAATRIAPIAMGLGLAMRKGMLSARAWAAPRLVQGAHGLQERVAPSIAHTMIATARKIEPSPRKRQTRWPMLGAGAALIVGSGAAAAFLRSRRSSESGPSAEPVVAPAPAQEAPAEEPISPS